MKKISELVTKFMEGILTTKAINYMTINNSWAKIVGDKVAAHSRLIDIENQVLIIEVDHPGWKNLIEMEKPKIIKTLTNYLPEEKFLKIVIRVNKRL